MSFDFSAVSDTLKRAAGKPVLLAAHVRPDGDAVGSLAAAVSILSAGGYNARAILDPETVPDGYRSFVPWNLTIPSAGPETPCSLFITLDCSNKERVAASDFPFLEKSELINLDHHPDNQKFGKVNVVMPEACSTAELLYHVFHACGLSIDAGAATGLLLGMVTDSGCFRFDNTTPSALKTAAALIESGARHHDIIVSAYSSREMGLVRLEADLIDHHFGTAHNGKTGWIILTRSELAKFGVDVRNTETLIDCVRNIAGIEFAALLREEPEKGGYKLSLRTKNAPYSAGRVARRLNGGGHEMAAGGFISAQSEQEAVVILLKNIEMEFAANEKQT